MSFSLRTFWQQVRDLMSQLHGRNILSQKSLSVRSSTVDEEMRDARAIIRRAVLTKEFLAMDVSEVETVCEREMPQRYRPIYISIIGSIPLDRL